MDAKITKLRLSRMLSYDWLKIIGTAAAAIVVWVLIFTMTATAITPAQTFTVGNYLGNVTFSDEFSKAFNNAFNDDVFTGEILELGVVDLTTSGDYAGQVLEARVTVGEGDVMFISQQPNPDTAYTEETTDENGEKVTETKYSHTYLETFLSGYRWKVHNLDLEDENSFFNKMERYLNNFYTNGYEDANSLDKQKVEDAFRARIKRTKDKRYKTEKSIQQGINEAIDRMEKYQKALLSFYGYLEQGLVSLTKTHYQLAEGEKYSFTGVYSINLCPNTDTMGKLSSLVSYNTVYTTEDGKEEVTTSAKDMNVCLFDLNGKEEEFRYEALLYVVNLIERVMVK